MLRYVTTERWSAFEVSELSLHLVANGYLYSPRSARTADGMQRMVWSFFLVSMLRFSEGSTALPSFAQFTSGTGSPPIFTSQRTE